jgi:hypothetical protein
MAATTFVTVAPAVPSGPAAAADTPADAVIAIARSKIGARYSYGHAGPTAFDCSGLVIYSFRKAGYAAAVGNGRYRSAMAMYRWFRLRGLSGRTNPRPGDVVVWGAGRHVGIYVGHGRAISALLSGVRLHGVTAVVDRFTAYLHTGMDTPVAAAAGATTSAKAPATRRTTAAVKLRDGVGMTHHVLTVLPRNTQFAVLASHADASRRTWYQVRIGTRLGWVAGWLTRAS